MKPWQQLVNRRMVIEMIRSLFYSFERCEESERAQGEEKVYLGDDTEQAAQAAGRCRQEFRLKSPLVKAVNSH